MKTLIVLLSILIFSSAQGQINNKGIEIYQVDLSLEDSTSEEKLHCNNCLDFTVDDLKEKPILTEEDIEEFEWSTQRIQLTEEAKERISTLNIPLKGLPVAMVLNGEIIYGFWLWNELSSFGCDRIYTYPTLDFMIKFGLPTSNTFGEDYRFDEQLYKYLKEK